MILSLNLVLLQTHVISSVVPVKVPVILHVYLVNKVIYSDKELMKIVNVWMDIMMME